MKTIGNIANGESALGISGQACLEQFSQFQHISPCAKMYAAILMQMNGWYSIRCKLNWKLNNTMIGRRYFQLQLSKIKIEELRIDLLPTPTASEGIRGEERKLSVKNGKIINISSNGVKYGINTRQLAEQGFIKLPSILNDRMGDEKDVKPKSVLKKIGLEWTGGLNMLENPGQLNPKFTMEMMGFPVTWTLLPFLVKGI